MTVAGAFFFAPALDAWIARRDDAIRRLVAACDPDSVSISYGYEVHHLPPVHATRGPLERLGMIPRR